jgi:cysteine synthase/rhodanese-related sulfurtransferase
MVDHSLRIYDSVLGLLSSPENPTPMVRLNRVVPFQHTQVYAKLEWYNPFGAVKDRVAANMVAEAECNNTIGADAQLVEPTSGNTGLGLAMISNAKGYQLTTPLSSAIPVEKRTMLKFFGVDVQELEDTLCPAPGAPEGAIATALKIAEQPDFHMLNQYANDANPNAHFKSTGPEIWRQTEGRVTHFVASMGTCGTITGVGRYLKEQNPDIQVLGIHPKEGHAIPGVRSIRQLQQTRFFQPDEYSQIKEVDDERAYESCLQLNREESITAGPSSGLALAGLLEMVPDEPGNVVVVIFPDSAFKYPSSLVDKLPGLASVQGPVGTPSSPLLDQIVELTRANKDLTIDLDDAHQLWDEEKPFVLDVRPQEQFDEAHIPDALSRPLSDLGEDHSGLPEDLETPILSVCQRGNASLSGVLVLKSLGYTNVRSMHGGTLAWREKGFPVEAA